MCVRLVSGFERTCHLFRTQRYKMVSRSDYTIRIRTPNVHGCLFWPASRKNRNENKIILCFWWIGNVSELLFWSGIVSTSSNYIWWGIALISLPISSFTMIWCLLQFANSKYRVNGRFFKLIVRIHWISRQAYSVRKDPDARLIMILRWWYLFISPAVGRKYIARVSLRRFATTVDSEYIFSLQQVI